MMGGNVVKEEQPKVVALSDVKKMTHVHSPPLVEKKKKRERIDADIPVESCPSVIDSNK